MLPQPQPPTDTPIMFLAGEFGCAPHWYAGFVWQSSLPGQELKFYIYPWYVGFDPSYPPFNAPPYAGLWMPITDPDMLAKATGKADANQPTLF